MGLVFILKANFIPWGRKAGGKIAKGSEKVWRKHLRRRKEARDSDDSKSYGDSTSMVLGQGQKT
jgi:hypothetical protein